MILSERKVLFSRMRRKKRIRKKVLGTPERPRLTVFKSTKHMYAQIIDDVSGKTLAAASTVSSEIRDEVKKMRKTEASKVVGALLAKKARENGIHRVVFDRNGFLFHGRIQALASAARENGLEF